MIELSKYTLEILRKDEEFVLYSGQREEISSRILVLFTGYMLIGPTSIATRHASSLKCLPAEKLCTSSMTS